MRYYIVDDDINVIKILEDLIEDKNLGRVVGFSVDGETAVKDIIDIKPDIVIIDYLMPKMDGPNVAKNVKKFNKNITFVAISQISDKEMIAEAYLSGIEFFISKPINAIEIEKVLIALTEKIKMSKTLSDLRNFLNESYSVNVNINRESINKDNFINKVKKILCDIGIYGEKGCYDLINICSLLIDMGYKGDEVINMNYLCEKLNEKPKVVKQRMRRAIAKGLKNIAYTGIEDNLNDCFIRYSNTLFDFENVKLEMDYIRGKRITGGKISLNRFLENLIAQVEKYE